MAILTGITTEIAGACGDATMHQERGEYEAAANCLAAIWEGPGSEPRVHDLDDAVAGEVLLLAGTLTGQLGSSTQMKESQELAKNLLCRAADRFQRTSNLDRFIDAQSSLATCYWRAGGFSEARTILRAALTYGSVSNRAKLRVLITLALVEKEAGQIKEALAIYSDCEEICEPNTSHFLLGSYHMNFAIALRCAGEIDSALAESMKACFHLDQCGNRNYQARVLNNMAMMLLNANRLTEAHENARRAERIFSDLNDFGSVAQTLDTRAQIYIAEKRYEEAERAARDAVQIISLGDHNAVAIQVMLTRATALLRLGKRRAAIEVFLEAYIIAEASFEEAPAVSVLSRMIEELAGPVCLAANVGLDSAVNAFEASIIREALLVSHGRVSETALRLGVSHQSLDFILQNRHKALEPLRAPRRKSPAKKPAKVLSLRRR